MPGSTTPVSKALSDIYAENKRLRDMLKSQYDKEQAKAEHRWQQQKVDTRNRQQTETHHQQTQQQIAQHQMRQQVKTDQATLAVLDQLKRTHKQLSLNQQQRHRQERLNETTVERAFRNAVRYQYRTGQQGLAEQLRNKRDDVRQTDYERQERERANKLGHREDQQQRAKWFGRAHYGLAGVGAATGIGNALQAPFLTDQQRFHAIGESLSRLGGPAGIVGQVITTFTDFRRMLDGSTAALARLH